MVNLFTEGGKRVASYDLEQSAPHSMDTGYPKSVNQVWTKIDEITSSSQKIYRILYLGDVEGFYFFIDDDSYAYCGVYKEEFHKNFNYITNWGAYMVTLPQSKVL
ncbi:MAG: hypothetical protein OXC48_03885 [Endozoicomonadaceae bacterium]|nr:hypothetical protein [Endozoicomonadaceae bacterium]